MPSTAELPILKELIRGGVGYGSNILVEFEPDSLWYETSLTIAANALISSGRVEYHTFVRTPKEVVEFLSKFVLDVDGLLQTKSLRIVDSYTSQIGLSGPDKLRSLRLSDMSIKISKTMKAGEVSRGLLHIDDNASILLQYNDEKTFVDVWRTRNLPQTRVAEAVYLYALVTGIGSSSFYRQLESLSDGIVDFKSPETAGQVEHLMRVRTMRGKTYDSRWRRLRLTDCGQVVLVE